MADRPLGNRLRTLTAANEEEETEDTRNAKNKNHIIYDFGC